jgi:hypothetical protein
MSRALYNTSYSIVFFIISFVLFLFGYSVVTKLTTITTREGFDGNDDAKGTGGTGCTQAALSTMVYQNAGAIENLKSSINSIMQNVNKLILSNDKQATQIQNLSDLESKYDKVAEEASQLAHANKLSLVQMAKEAQQKAQSIQSQAEQLQSP